jgi:hypothetical protein
VSRLTALLLLAVALALMPGLLWALGWPAYASLASAALATLVSLPPAGFTVWGAASSYRFATMGWGDHALVLFLLVTGVLAMAFPAGLGWLLYMHGLHGWAVLASLAWMGWTAFYSVVLLPGIAHGLANP